MKLFNPLLIILILSLSVSKTLLGQEGLAASEQTAATLPASILGHNYVDLRNGFSLRPPAKSTITPIANLPLNGTPNPIPDLSQWESLKLPGSKPLVCFHNPEKNQTLYAYLFVTRNSMTIEHMLEARSNYWNTHTPQATIISSETESINDMPTALTKLAWKQNENSPVLHVCETLIQREKNRYFLLAFTYPDSSENNPKTQLLTKMIQQNFVCMSESEINERWIKARNKAQNLLNQQSSATLKSSISGKKYYHIRYHGKPVGFHYTNLFVDVREDKSHTFQNQLKSYVNSAIASKAFSHMLGVYTDSKLNQDTLFTGPAKINASFQLDSTLKQESFKINILNHKTNKSIRCESGKWQDNVIAIQLCENASQQQESPLEPLTIGSKVQQIFLPLTLSELSTSLIDRTVGQEYVFLRYVNQTLGFYSLRVAANVNLVMQNPDDSSATKEINASYLVSQLNSHGPIIETWLDELGKIVKIKASSVELIPTTLEELKKDWEKELKSLNLLSDNN